MDYAKMSFKVLRNFIRNSPISLSHLMKMFESLEIRDPYPRGLPYKEVGLTVEKFEMNI